MQWSIRIFPSSSLKIDYCFQGSLDKMTPYKELCNIYDVTPENIAYIGDGLIDIPVMTKSGFAVSPKNAHKLVKDVSDYVSEKSGGEGVLREVVELILEVQGIYEKTLECMKKKIYKT